MVKLYSYILYIMSYKIKKLQLEKAKELGVNIKPSTNPNKKVDVFVGTKKLASIGANKSAVKGKPMGDYATYVIQEPKIAELRREGYIKRHSKEPKRDKDTGGFSKSFFSDEIMWSKKNQDVNKSDVKAFSKYREKLLKEQEEKKKKLMKSLMKK